MRVENRISCVRGFKRCAYPCSNPWSCHVHLFLHHPSSLPRTHLARAPGHCCAAHFRMLARLLTRKIPRPCARDDGFRIHVALGPVRRNSSMKSAMSAGRLCVTGMKSRADTSWRSFSSSCGMGGRRGGEWRGVGRGCARDAHAVRCGRKEPPARQRLARAAWYPASFSLVHSPLPPLLSAPQPAPCGSAASS